MCLEVICEIPISPLQDFLTATFIHSWPLMFEEHLIKVSPFNLEPKECCDILEIAENTTA